MTQALLTNTNSLWGVIINPNSSNTYRHALSFATEDLKHQYISKNLFGGTDYRTLFDSAPKISFAITSASSAIAKIDIKDYPNETQQSLANKDFMIIKENGKYWYYAITNAEIVNMSIVKFTLELDIFFQYDVKDMFNNAPVMIERAMTDRFYKDQSNNIIPIHQSDHEYEDDLSDPILFPEPFEIDNSNLMITNYEEMQENIDSYFDSSVPQNKRDEISKSISLAKFSVLYRSIEKGGHLANIGGYNSKNNVCYSYILDNSEYFQYLPYSILVAPLDILDSATSQNVYQVNYFFNNAGDFIIKPEEQLTSFSKPHIEEPSVITNTFTISPFSIIKFFTPDELKIKLRNNNQIDVIIKTPLSYYDNKHVKPVVYSYHGDGDALQAEHMLVIRGYDRNIWDLPTSKPFKSIKVFPEFSNFSINQKVKDINYKNEIKSYFAPYRNFVLKGMSNLEKNLNPQMFNDSFIKLKYMFSFIPELWNTIIYPLNYGNHYYEDDDQNRIIPTNTYDYFEDIAPYGLPTEKNMYQEYINSHKSQMTAGLWNQVPQTMLGIAGGMVSGNPLAIAGSISGAISNINMTFALQKDLKREPLQLTNISSTLVRDISFKNVMPSITEMQLPQFMMTHIRQFFYTWGHAMNMYQDDINNYLNTRYYFNYIQVPQTFENNKLQASAEIKQIINDTIAEGLTIWHVRDLLTFKGIKNYEYENLEMNLISSPSPAPEEVENAEEIKI